MRKLTMLTLLAVAVATLSGCNRGWPRWMCRGDECFESDGCADGMMGGGSTLLPPSYGPSTTILPGPAPATVPAG